MGKRDFAVYSGEDITALPLHLMGGHGVISVTANVAPEPMARMCRAGARGRFRDRARDQRPAAAARTAASSSRPNPAPAKWALAADGAHRQRTAAAAGAALASCHEPVRALRHAAGCLEPDEHGITNA